MHLTKQILSKSSGGAEKSTNYRGYQLPPGMTPECFDELAELINRHTHELDDDLDCECGIKAFKIVAKHLMQRPDER